MKHLGLPDISCLNGCWEKNLIHLVLGQLTAARTKSRGSINSYNYECTLFLAICSHGSNIFLRGSASCDMWEKRLIKLLKYLRFLPGKPSSDGDAKIRSPTVGLLKHSKNATTRYSLLKIIKGNAFKMHIYWCALGIVWGKNWCHFAWYKFKGLINRGLNPKTKNWSERKDEASRSILLKCHCSHSNTDQINISDWLDAKKLFFKLALNFLEQCIYMSNMHFNPINVSRLKPPKQRKNKFFKWAFI